MALSPQKRQLYERFFKGADKDGSGCVDKLELAKAVNKNTGGSTSVDEVVEMFEGCDHNRDGRITMEEFLKEMGKADRRKGYEEIFRKWDSDGSGHLSREEVHKACKQAKCELTDEQIDQQIQKLDKNNDGKITIKEFMKLV